MKTKSRKRTLLLALSLSLAAGAALAQSPGERMQSQQRLHASNTGTLACSNLQQRNRESGRTLNGRRQESAVGQTSRRGQFNGRGKGSGPAANRGDRPGRSAECGNGYGRKSPPGGE
jgi:hypothetical protein